MSDCFDFLVLDVQFLSKNHYFVTVHKSMKLDTSGLESTAPLFGTRSELLDGFSATPSFELPNTINVSSNVFGILYCLARQG